MLVFVFFFSFFCPGCCGFRLVSMFRICGFGSLSQDGNHHVDVDEFLEGSVRFAGRVRNRKMGGALNQMGAICFGGTFGWTSFAVNLHHLKVVPY